MGGLSGKDGSCREDNTGTRGHAGRRRRARAEGYRGGLEGGGTPATGRDRLHRSGKARGGGTPATETQGEEPGEETGEARGARIAEREGRPVSKKRGAAVYTPPQGRGQGV